MQGPEALRPRLTTGLPDHCNVTQFGTVTLRVKCREGETGHNCIKQVNSVTLCQIALSLMRENQPVARKPLLSSLMRPRNIAAISVAAAGRAK